MRWWQKVGGAFVCLVVGLAAYSCGDGECCKMCGKGVASPFILAS
jgi:hypothetical protein